MKRWAIAMLFFLNDRFSPSFIGIILVDKSSFMNINTLTTLTPIYVPSRIITSQLFDWEQSRHIFHDEIMYFI